MSENKRVITLGNKKYLVIELTQPLKEDVEVYPGDPKPEKIVFSDISNTGFQHHIYKLGDHNFQPHADAPKHQNKDLQDKGIEIFGLDFCFNKALLIDISQSEEAIDFDGIKYLVKVGRHHLEPYDKIISQKGAIIIRTGYDQWLELNKKHTPKNIPHLDKDAAEYIADFKNIKVVGFDSITIDACGKDTPFHIAHQALKDKLIVESLVHLYEIPLNSRENFDLQISPLRIVGATGSPVIAYAFIEL